MPHNAAVPEATGIDRLEDDADNYVDNEMDDAVDDAASGLQSVPPQLIQSLASEPHLCHLNRSHRGNHLGHHIRD